MPDVISTFGAKLGGFLGTIGIIAQVGAVLIAIGGIGFFIIRKMQYNRKCIIFYKTASGVGFYNDLGKVSGEKGNIKMYFKSHPKDSINLEKLGLSVQDAKNTLTWLLYKEGDGSYTIWTPKILEGTISDDYDSLGRSWFSLSLNEVYSKYPNGSWLQKYLPIISVSIIVVINIIFFIFIGKQFQGVSNSLVQATSINAEYLKYVANLTMNALP
jgi:hypothetical protein